MDGYVLFWYHAGLEVGELEPDMPDSVSPIYEERAAQIRRRQLWLEKTSNPPQTTSNSPQKTSNSPTPKDGTPKPAQSEVLWQRKNDKNDPTKRRRDEKVFPEEMNQAPVGPTVHPPLTWVRC